MHRIVAVAFATAILALSPTAAAVADETDELNTGTLTYSITLEQDGMSQKVTLAVECAAGVCTMDFPDPDIGQLVFIDGVATIDIPEGAWDCSTTGDNRGYAGEFRLTDTQLVGSYGTTERVVTGCPGIVEGTVIAGSASPLELDFETGRLCLIDGSCEPVSAEETIAASGGSFEPGARNGLALPAGADRHLLAPTKLSVIATFDDVATPFNTMWAGAATLVLFILVAVPVFWGGRSLNRLVDRARRGTATESATPGLRGWGWAAGGVAAAAAITAFNDPNAGLDAATARVAVTYLAAFAVSILAGWAIAALLVRAVDRDAAPTVRFSPFALIAALAAVVLSRVFDFQPAFAFAFVGAVAFTGVATAGRRGRLALLTIAWAFVLGVGTWFVYSGLDASDPGLTVVRELLAAVALAGIAGAPFALLPVPGFPGASIWGWSKLVWLPVFLVTLFAWVFVFLPMPALSTERIEAVFPEIATWLAVSVLASLVGIVLLIVSGSLRRRDRKRAVADAPVDAEVEPAQA